MKKASIPFKIGMLKGNNFSFLLLTNSIFFQTNSYNFHGISRVTQIKTYSWDNAQVILVGNKCDMEEERVISFERGKQLADQLGVEFFETSAKENINVKVRTLFVE